MKYDRKVRAEGRGMEGWRDGGKQIWQAVKANPFSFESNHINEVVNEVAMNEMVINGEIIMII